MNYFLEEVAFLAPRCEHHEFRECVSVPVPVGLQLDRCRCYAEDMRYTAVGEEPSEHAVSLSRIQMCLVDEHLREAETLEFGSEVLYRAYSGISYLCYLPAPETRAVYPRIRAEVAAQRAILQVVLLQQLFGGLEDYQPVAAVLGYKGGQD